MSIKSIFGYILSAVILVGVGLIIWNRIVKASPTASKIITGS
jgi:hypothetical protein